jgi:hypothetical protein
MTEYEKMRRRPYSASGTFLTDLAERDFPPVRHIND